MWEFVTAETNFLSLPSAILPRLQPAKGCQLTNKNYSRRDPTSIKGKCIHHQVQIVKGTHCPKPLQGTPNFLHLLSTIVQLRQCPLLAPSVRAITVGVMIKWQLQHAVRRSLSSRDEVNSKEVWVGSGTWLETTDFSQVLISHGLLQVLCVQCLLQYRETKLKSFTQWPKSTANNYYYNSIS